MEESEDASPERTVAGDGATLAGSPSWRRLQAELLSGVRHEVLGRVSALRSLIQIGRLGRYSTDDLISMLEEETDRLERPADWLRALPEDDGGPAEPVGVRDLLGEVASLAAAVAETGELEVRLPDGGDWPPVRADHGELARSLLSVLVGVGGLSSAVRVRGEREEGGLRLTVEAMAPTGEAAGRGRGFPLAPGDGGLEVAPELRSAVAALGGEISVDSEPGTGPRATLRLPASTAGEGDAGEA